MWASLHVGRGTCEMQALVNERVSSLFLSLSCVGKSSELIVVHHRSHTSLGIICPLPFSLHP